MSILVLPVCIVGLALLWQLQGIGPREFDLIEIAEKKFNRFVVFVLPGVTKQSRNQSACQ